MAFAVKRRDGCHWGCGKIDALLKLKILGTSNGKRLTSDCGLQLAVSYAKLDAKGLYLRFWTAISCSLFNFSEHIKYDFFFVLMKTLKWDLLMDFCIIALRKKSGGTADDEFVSSTHWCVIFVVFFSSGSKTQVWGHCFINTGTT